TARPQHAGAAGESAGRPPWRLRRRARTLQDRRHGADVDARERPRQRVHARSPPGLGARLWPARRHHAGRGARRRPAAGGGIAAGGPMTLSKNRYRFRVKVRGKTSRETLAAKRLIDDIIEGLAFERKAGRDPGGFGARERSAE